MREYLCDLGIGKNLKTHKIYDKFYHIKIKDFCSMKDTIDKVIGQMTKRQIGRRDL